MQLHLVHLQKFQVIESNMLLYSNFTSFCIYG